MHLSFWGGNKFILVCNLFDEMRDIFAKSRLRKQKAYRQSKKGEDYKEVRPSSQQKNITLLFPEISLLMPQYQQIIAAQLIVLKFVVLLI